MTDLSFGPKILATPGPTGIPDVVLQAMHRPAIDIYGGELEEITHSILGDLKTLLRAQNARSYLYIANGHGGWEAAIANVFSRGEKVLVLESGRFAPGWGEQAAAMGVEVEILPGRERGGVDPDAVEARLRADGERRIKAVMVAHIDTASGAYSDVAAIRAAIDASGHDALYLVDGVASVGCIPFEMDAWGVDLALTASQKGLMTPPGLAAILAGPRALEAGKTADLRTQYWSWEFRDGPLHYQKYCGTPPVHLLFGLRRAMDLLMTEEGLEAAWARHHTLAGAVRAAAAAWAEAQPRAAVEFNILNDKERSDTVTALRVHDGFNADALRALTQSDCGVTLGAPIGHYAGPGGAFRIAHMGHASAASIMGALGATETAMRALGWPVGDNALGAGQRFFRRHQPCADRLRRRAALFGAALGRQLHRRIEIHLTA